MALYGRSDTKNTIEPSFTPNFLNLEKFETLCISPTPKNPSSTFLILYAGKIEDIPSFTLLTYIGSSKL